MSLLSAVEEAIKTRKAEQAKIDRSIQVYKGILQNLIAQPETASYETELADAEAADAESSSGEKEDIELLERALEKALWVRTASNVSKEDSSKIKLSAIPKETVITTAMSAVTKEGQPTITSIKKSARLQRKAQCSRPSARHKPTQSRNITQQNPHSAAAGHHQPSRRLQQAVLVGSASGDLVTASFSKNKTVRSNMPRDDGLRKATSVSMPSSNTIASYLGTDGSGADRSQQQNGGVSEPSKTWRSLRSKQNRLWEKVTALQKKPEPGRKHFLQKMRTMFPNDWPCGSPDETRFLLHRLTDQGRSLAHRCRMEEILAKQPSEMATEPLGGRQTESLACPTLDRLHLTAADLHFFADEVIQGWKAWDRWRPEGGCLCPSVASGLFGEGAASPLPLTITYSTEKELQELERLRMRVALLQQEIYLEQVLLDTLSPQFSTIRPGLGCPSPSALRDLYSLLGEGGERFAAIVQDSEHE